MSKWSRIGWGSMALMFLLIAIVTTILTVTQNKNQQNPNYISCTQGGTLPNQQPKDGRVKGAQLADFKPPQKISSIGCIDYKVGTGATAQSTSLVTVNYVGALASNGTIFDDSFDTGQPFTTTLNQVIPGWSIGIPGMKEGGVRRIFIPAGLAYGASGAGTIPPNSDLIFDVQLKSVK